MASIISSPFESEYANTLQFMEFYNTLFIDNDSISVISQ